MISPLFALTLLPLLLFSIALFFFFVLWQKTQEPRKTVSLSLNFFYIFFKELRKKSLRTKYFEYQKKNQTKKIKLKRTADSSFSKEKIKMSAGADSSSTSMRLSEKHQKALLKKQRYEFLLGPFPVQLSKTKTKGRHLLASQDLDPGTLILQEFPVGWSFFKNAIETHCAFCLKEIQEDRKSGHTASDFGMNGLNLSPSSPSDPSSIVQADKAPKWCSKCRKQTRYCSSKCLDLDLQRHALECKLVTELPGIAGAHSTDYSLLRLILRFLSNRVHKETFQSDFDQDCKENEFLPSWNAFMATKDLVGSPTALANTKWLNCIQNAGMFPFVADFPNINLKVETFSKQLKILWRMILTTY
jgi:hypothetical protein